MVEVAESKRIQQQGWVVVRIAGLAALGICLSLFVAYGARQHDEVTVAPVAQASPTSARTPTVFIPGMPALCPTPTPGGPAVDASVPFGLAWFHKPPGDDTSASTIAKEHRYIHLTGRSDIAYRDELREAGFKGPIYTYVTASAVEGPGPYLNASASCDSNYTPYDNNLAWDKGDFCRYIHPNESWFLHNGKGERLVDDYFGTGRYTYAMNPGDAGWQAFAQERLLFARDHWFYDGVWLDNVDLDMGRASREAKNSDGQVKEYGDDTAWRAAMSGWLAGLRTKLGSWPVWANLVGGRLDASAWDAYAPYLDGAMDESFAVRWIGEWRDPYEWVAQTERAERWLAAGKGLVMVGQGGREDKERLLFTLASYMLVANDKASFRYTRFDSYYDSLWLYPEYDTARALGAATGSHEEVSPGVWQRQFEHGYAEVNVGAHVGRLVLDDR